MNNMIQFPSEEKFPKKYPFDICMYLAGDNKLLGYFTYLSYKNYKLSKIKDYKGKYEKEPSATYLNNFKENLTEKDYESFLRDANENIKELFSPLVNSALKEQLPTAIKDTNYSKIEQILHVTKAEKIGVAVDEIHNATTKECKSFWISVGASALGAFLLALIFVLIEVAFDTGLFTMIYQKIVS